MGSQGNEVPFSTSTRGYLKYRIYDSTNTYDIGSNLFLQYQSDLRNAINKWDAIVSPNTTYFNSSPYYYTHEIEIDIDIKDFAIDHDTQMDIFLTNYVYFGFPASYGLTFPTAGKFEIDYEFIEEVKNKTRIDGKSSLYYLFLHGIGHLLGIGTLWGANLSNDPLQLHIEDDGVEAYYYKKTSHAFDNYIQYYPINANSYVGIPVEDNGGEGTANHHFEVGISNNGFASTDDRHVGGILNKGINATEVMTVWTKELTNTQFISKISIGILHDIGYEVDYGMADTQYVGEPGTNISWMNIDFSNYPDIGNDVETTKSIMESIISDTNKDENGEPIIYDITIYGKTFTGSDANVLGQASWSTGDIWLNRANSGVYGLNGVDVSKNVAVMFHEILHVLGCVGVGERGGQFINGTDTRPYNTYIGTHGVTQYRKVLTMNEYDTTHMTENLFPLEDDYGYGTETFHFEEDTHRHRWINGLYYNTIKNEIMSGIMNGENFITSMTLGALQDLGFSVEYDSVNVEDTHTELDISQKPTMTYISQLTDNPVVANSSGYHFFNDETDRTNFVGLNVGKYVLELTGTGSSWSFLGFHLPSYSITSANQEIFIDETYPGTVVETTTTTGGLSYTYYSGKVEIEVIGDFGMIVMNNRYGSTRNLVFERAAPRYETIQFEAGWEFFGVLDLKVAMTLNLKDETEDIYKYKNTDDGYETTTSNTMKLNTGNASYWLKSSNTNQVSLLVDYTLHNEVTYDSGHEVTIPVKEGVNVFGTLIKKMTLSASNDESLINKNSLLKYDSIQRRYSSVSYAEELDNKVGYSIEAYSSGEIKAVIS
jgi:hypothetical protein